MSLGLIGKKIGMTREFMETGQSVPVTVIKIEKGRVLDIITKEKRGYNAIKVGLPIRIEKKNKSNGNYSKIFQICILGGSQGAKNLSIKIRPVHRKNLRKKIT